MRTTRFRYAKNRKIGRPTNFKVLGAIKPKVPKQDLLIYLFQLIRFKDNWKCWMQQSLYTLNEYRCLYYLLVTDCFTCVAFFYYLLVIDCFICVAFFIIFSLVFFVLFCCWFILFLFFLRYRLWFCVISLIIIIF